MTSRVINLGLSVCVSDSTEARSSADRALELSTVGLLLFTCDVEELTLTDLKLYSV